jgi:hypothetical protein
MSNMALSIFRIAFRGKEMYIAFLEIQYYLLYSNTDVQYFNFAKEQTRYTDLRTDIGMH